jgi:RNA polymerase sigma-70 factor (ECF subfamily)
LALRLDDVDLVRDRALVERFQEGDQGAFDTLYTRYFDRLVRFCRKRVGDPYEAEEIAQEAFARALRALPTFEGERRFYPWMTVIAGRLCVDSHRRRGRSEPSAAVDLGVIEGGQEKIVDAVDVEILRTAMGSLAPRHREVLDLREQQGWSYQQIADHYDVTLGTVEALLFRARKALKREFMAVVGGDRNWAALPGLGLVARRMAAMKAKVEAWAAAAGVPSFGGATVAAAVIAVTAVGGVVGVGVLRDGSGSVAQQRAVVRVGGLANAASTTPLPEVLPGVRDGSPAADAAAGPARTRNGSGGVAAGPVAVGQLTPPTPATEETTYDNGREIGSQQPVQIGLADEAFAAVDPGGAVADVVGGISNYVQKAGNP